MASEKIERTYIIPLRKEWLKAPKYKRAKKAVTAIKKFLLRHMKAGDIKNIKILNELNLKVWERGIKNPPCRIKVDVIKDEKSIVRANLSGFSVAEPEKIKKKTSKRKTRRSNRQTQNKTSKK